MLSCLDLTGDLGATSVGGLVFLAELSRSRDEADFLRSFSYGFKNRFF